MTEPGILPAIVSAILADGRHILVHDGAHGLTPMSTDAELIEIHAERYLRRGASITLYVSQPGSTRLDSWVGLIPRAGGGVQVTHGYAVWKLIEQARGEAA